MIKTAKNIFIQYKKTVLSSLLFLIIFSSLGLFYGTWGMATDDWGNIRHSRAAKTLKDLPRYFINIEMINHGEFTHPKELSTDRQAFFAGLLRPLSFAYYWVQHHLFGLNPYAYFLTSAAFHAASCVLLFFIFSAFVSLFWAFSSALFFGFHPSLWLWWGWISPQSYYIELFFLLLIFLYLHKFLQTSRLWYYLLACLFYAHNLLLREQTFFLSLWLIPFFYFYDVIHTSKQQKFWINIGQYTKRASGFLIITLSYILLRLSLFPLTSNTATLTFKPTWESFLQRYADRFFDLVTYIANLCALSALPLNHQYIKGMLILSIFTVLLYLFMHNTHKSVIAFLAISIPLFSWPALIMHHQPRYAYMSFPLSIFMVLLLFRYYKGKKLPVHRMIPGIAFLIFIGINACMITKYTLKRQEKCVTGWRAFTELINNPLTKNRSLYLIGLPPFFSVGCIQAVWLLRDDYTTPVHANGLNIVAHDIMGPPHNYLTYTSTANGLLCTTSNPNEIAFEDENHNQTTTRFIPIDTLASKENPLYIIWNYETRRFIILGDAAIFEKAQ